MPWQAQRATKPPPYPQDDTHLEPPLCLPSFIEATGPQIPQAGTPGFSSIAFGTHSPQNQGRAEETLQDKGSTLPLKQHMRYRSPFQAGGQGKVQSQSFLLPCR